MHDTPKWNRLNAHTLSGLSAWRPAVDSLIVKWLVTWPSLLWPVAEPVVIQPWSSPMPMFKIYVLLFLIPRGTNFTGHCGTSCCSRKTQTQMSGNHVSIFPRNFLTFDPWPILSGVEMKYKVITWYNNDQWSFFPSCSLKSDLWDGLLFKVPCFELLDTGH